MSGHKLHAAAQTWVEHRSRQLPGARRVLRGLWLWRHSPWAVTLASVAGVDGMYFPIASVGFPRPDVRPVVTPSWSFRD